MRDEIQLFQGTVIVFERCLFLGMWVETTSSSFPNTEKQASPRPRQKKKKKKTTKNIPCAIQDPNSYVLHTQGWGEGK
jgi:hypothetical protein